MKRASGNPAKAQEQRAKTDSDCPINKPREFSSADRQSPQVRPLLQTRSVIARLLNSRHPEAPPKSSKQGAETDPDDFIADLLELDDSKEERNDKDTERAAEPCWGGAKQSGAGLIPPQAPANAVEESCEEAPRSTGEEGGDGIKRLRHGAPGQQGGFLECQRPPPSQERGWPLPPLGSDDSGSKRGARETSLSYNTNGQQPNISDVLQLPLLQPRKV